MHLIFLAHNYKDIRLMMALLYGAATLKASYWAEITGKRRSLRAIAKELAKLGHVAVSGNPYGAESVKRMVGG